MRTRCWCRGQVRCCSGFAECCEWCASAAALRCRRTTFSRTATSCRWTKAHQCADHVSAQRCWRPRDPALSVTGGRPQPVILAIAASVARRPINRPAVTITLLSRPETTLGGGVRRSSADNASWTTAAGVPRRVPPSAASPTMSKNSVSVRSRRQREYPETGPLGFPPKRFGEALHESLARPVYGHVRRGLIGRGTGHVDQDAALALT
jgi:hypothetical protein